MKRHFDTDLPADLADVAQRLTQDAPRMSALELDELKRRVSTRGARSATNPTRSLMRARLTIMSLLAAGILMTSGGATLAVSGLQDSNNAGVAQYGVTTTQPSENRGVSGTLGEVAEEQPAAEQQPSVQAPRQVAQAGDGELPFTGFASIPVLLLGIALLSAGLVLRRGARRDSGA